MIAAMVHVAEAVEYLQLMNSKCIKVVGYLVSYNEVASCMRFGKDITDNFSSFLNWI